MCSFVLMKRGSLRCESDSATPSGLQQAAIGRTGEKRVQPCRQSPVYCPGGRKPAHTRTPPAAGPQPDTAGRAGAPRAAPPALRPQPGRAGPAAPPLAEPRAPHPHWLRPAPSAAEEPSAAPRRASPSHAPGPTNDLMTGAALPCRSPIGRATRL